MQTTSQSILQKQVPDIFTSFLSIHGCISDSGIDQKLSHLIMLRVSQINQCGYCVALHTKEARTDGETNERLDQLIVFQCSPNFTEQEKLVLTWAEQLTYLSSSFDYQTLRDQLLSFYSEQEVSALTALVCMINTWNRIRRSEH